MGGIRWTEQESELHGYVNVPRSSLPEGSGSSIRSETSPVAQRQPFRDAIMESARLLRESERHVAELLEENNTLKIRNIVLMDDLEACQARLADSELSMRLLLEQLSDHQKDQAESSSEESSDSETRPSSPVLPPSIQHPGSISASSSRVEHNGGNINTKVDDTAWKSHMINWTDSKALEHFENTMVAFQTTRFSADNELTFQQLPWPTLSRLESIQGLRTYVNEEDITRFFAYVTKQRPGAEGVQTMKRTYEVFQPGYWATRKLLQFCKKEEMKEVAKAAKRVSSIVTAAFMDIGARKSANTDETVEKSNPGLGELVSE